MYKLSSTCIFTTCQVIPRGQLPNLEGPLSLFGPTSCCLCHQQVCPDCTTWGRWEARTRSIQLTVEREVSRHVSGRPIEIRWLALCSCTSARSAWWVQRGQERIKFCGEDHLFVGVDIVMKMNTVCTCCFHTEFCLRWKRAACSWD